MNTEASGEEIHFEWLLVLEVLIVLVSTVPLRARLRGLYNGLERLLKAGRAALLAPPRLNQG